MAIDDNLTQRRFAEKVQGLVDILIDFSKDTDTDLRDILANYKPDIVE